MKTTIEHIALMLVGKTEDERRANLKSAMEGVGIETDNPGKYKDMLVVQCGVCDRNIRYKTFEDIPMEDVMCQCKKSWLIRTTPEWTKPKEEPGMTVLDTKRKPIALMVVSGGEPND